ncbi:MAG: PhzF family phenazine biosynthesis isomerase [Oligoflexales bacterium]|nr:PhzF family phenazine biosynthesis isomerase [Oligoflexales bacterium]
MKVWIVTAFAKIATAGNLAGVAVVDEFPSDKTMLSIASELNYSETAFVKPLNSASVIDKLEASDEPTDFYEIRWFTPKYEVDLCGHATMASAFLLWNQGFSQATKISFMSKSGPLHALKVGEEITLDFPLQSTMNLEGFVFNWEKALGGPHPINTAIGFGAFTEYIVELESTKELANLKPDIDEIAKLPGNGLIVTAKGEDFGPYDFVSRVFAPQDGIPEDPVTISAHCKLAHYWEERFGKTKFLAFQASARGGEIKLERHGKRVLFTGSALLIESRIIPAL